MGLRTQEVWFTSGGLAASGRNAQDRLPSATSMKRLPGSTPPSRGSGAPISTQRTKSARTASDSLPRGGIFLISPS